MFPGQKSAVVLQAKDGIVRVLSDEVTSSFSIGLRTSGGMEWKYISKELHDLLVKELSEQEGKSLG